MRKGILRKRILEGQFRKGIAEGHFRKGRKGTVHKLEFIPFLEIDEKSENFVYEFQNGDLVEF